MGLKAFRLEYNRILTTNLLELLVGKLCQGEVCSNNVLAAGATTFKQIHRPKDVV